jgi:hypothetical protein
VPAEFNSMSDQPVLYLTYTPPRMERQVHSLW